MENILAVGSTSFIFIKKNSRCRWGRLIVWSIFLMTNSIVRGAVYLYFSNVMFMEFPTIRSHIISSLIGWYSCLLSPISRASFRFLTHVFTFFSFGPFAFTIVVAAITPLVFIDVSVLLAPLTCCIVESREVSFLGGGRCPSPIIR